VTVCLAATAEVVAVNVAVAAPATVTVAGSVTAALLLASVTTTPPAGATPDKVTVHVLFVPPATLAGAHCIEDSVTGGGAIVRLVFCEVPL
jgi:hypothetical protein